MATLNVCVEIYINKKTHIYTFIDIYIYIYLYI